jgi:hypothetical protein
VFSFIIFHYFIYSISIVFWEQSYRYGYYRFPVRAHLVLLVTNLVVLPYSRGMRVTDMPHEQTRPQQATLACCVCLQDVADSGCGARSPASPISRGRFIGWYLLLHRGNQ